MNYAQKLFDMKEQLERAQSDTDMAKGRYEAASDRLKKEFTCSTLKKAETKSDKMEQKIEKMNREISEGIKELEDDHEWD